MQKFIAFVDGRKIRVTAKDIVEAMELVSCANPGAHITLHTAPTRAKLRGWLAGLTLAAVAFYLALFAAYADGLIKFGR
jgi:hypothetical protein